MKKPIILPSSNKINQENARKKIRRENSLAKGAEIFSNILLELTKSVPNSKMKKNKI